MKAVAKSLGTTTFTIALVSLAGCNLILGLDGFVDSAPAEDSSGSGGAAGTAASGATSTATGSASAGGAGGAAASGTGGAGPGTSSSSEATSSSSSAGGAGGAGGAMSVILVENDGAVFNTENFGTTEDSGQGFTLGTDSTITAIAFRGSQGNAKKGTHFHLEVRAGSINGQMLSTTQFDTANDLPAFTSTPDWVNLSLGQPLQLPGGAIAYYIRIFADDGDPVDELRWSWDNADGYPNGSMFRGITPFPGADHNFRIIGHSP